MSLAPVPSESANCSNCSAPLVADQRYCLSCGQPCSPVRLAFLDVLQTEHQPQAAGAGVRDAPPSTTPSCNSRRQPQRLAAPLRAPVRGAVGAADGDDRRPAGRPLGHAEQVPERADRESRGPLRRRAGGRGRDHRADATTSTTSTTASGAKSSAPSEADEVKKEAKAEKQQAAKVEHAAVVKPSSTKLKKLGSSTGKKHEEEINALGAQPIETGG